MRRSLRQCVISVETVQTNLSVRSINKDPSVVLNVWFYSKMVGRNKRIRKWYWVRDFLILFNHISQKDLDMFVLSIPLTGTDMWCTIEDIIQAGISSADGTQVGPEERGIKGIGWLGMICNIDSWIKQRNDLNLEITQYA